MDGMELNASQILAQDAIALRRWYVENVVLNASNRAELAGQTPSDDLLKLVRQAPTPEHQGVVSRMIYNDMGQTTLILDKLPSLTQPKSWNQADRMWDLVMWLYRPWESLRWDPRAETLQVCLPNNQWAFHLKGSDSEGSFMSWLSSVMVSLDNFGFSQVVTWMSDTGLMPTDPRDYDMSAEDFAKSFSLCDAAFTKFMSRTSARKELFEELKRSSMMMADTSTLNSMVNLAAFGNGVVPTADIYEQYDEDTAPVMTIPAGKLIPADREFMLGSATGLSWPENPDFDRFVQFRADIHNGLSEDGWDDWVDGSRVYMDMLLRSKAPTYRRFLDHAFPHDDTTPPEERDAFLRLLGAAVFGSNLKIVAAMIGAPNAGKDTVIKWLSYMLGNDQVGVLSPTALSAMADDQRAFAPLKGARLAVVSGEVGEGRAQGILAEKIKSITSGGGTLTVAEKYEKPTTIFFDGMLIMQGNSVPTIIGGDKALYKNRLVAVEFKHPFPLQANSFEREYRREAPHFLQVLFLAYCDYVERGGGMMGIAPPDSWRAFSEQVEFSADALAVIDRCLTHSRTIEIPSTQFYKALSILAERHLGLRYPMSSNKWAARLKKAGIEIVKDVNTKHRSRVNRADYKGWMFHVTLDADEADGLFSQDDWENALQLASVALS